MARKFLRRFPARSDLFPFGPFSFRRHTSLLARNGYRVRVLHSSALQLEIDTPEDLALLASRKKTIRLSLLDPFGENCRELSTLPLGGVKPRRFIRREGRFRAKIRKP